MDSTQPARRAYGRALLVAALAGFSWCVVSVLCGGPSASAAGSSDPDDSRSTSWSAELNPIAQTVHAGLAGIAEPVTSISRYSDKAASAPPVVPWMAGGIPQGVVSVVDDHTTALGLGDLADALRDAVSDVARMPATVHPLGQPGALDSPTTIEHSSDLGSHPPMVISGTPAMPVDPGELAPVISPSPPPLNGGQWLSVVPEPATSASAAGGGAAPCAVAAGVPSEPALNSQRVPRPDDAAPTSATHDTDSAPG